MNFIINRKNEEKGVAKQWPPLDTEAVGGRLQLASGRRKHWPHQGSSGRGAL